MPFVIRCPNPKCRSHLRAREEWAGKRIRCPACQENIEVPAKQSSRKVSPIAAGPPKAQGAGIRIYCPNGHLLNTQEKYIGKQVLCPQCQAVLTVEIPEAVKLTPPSAKIGSKSAKHEPPARRGSPDPAPARRGSPDPAEGFDRRSPDAPGDEGDLRSGELAGSGDPRRAGGELAGSGDPRRAGGELAGSGDPRRAGGELAGSGDARRAGGELAGSGDPRRAAADNERVDALAAVEPVASEISDDAEDMDEAPRSGRHNPRDDDEIVEDEEYVEPRFRAAPAAVEPVEAEICEDEEAYDFDDSEQTRRSRRRRPRYDDDDDYRPRREFADELDDIVEAEAYDDDAEEADDEPRRRNRRDEGEPRSGIMKRRGRRRQKKGATRQQYKLTNLGLGFHYGRFVACLFDLFVLLVCFILASFLFGGVAAGARGRQVVGFAVVLDVLLVLCVFVLLLLPFVGMAGSALCCAAPEQTRARPLIIASLALDGIAIFLNCASIIAPPFILLSLFCWLAAFVLFLLFLRRIAYYFDQDGTGEEAMSVVIHLSIFIGACFIGLIILGVVTAILRNPAATVGFTTAFALAMLIAWVNLTFRIVALIGSVRQFLRTYTGA